MARKTARPQPPQVSADGAAPVAASNTLRYGTPTGASPETTSPLEDVLFAAECLKEAFGKLGGEDRAELAVPGHAALAYLAPLIERTRWILEARARKAAKATLGADGH